MNYLHVISRMDPQLGGVSQAVRTMVNGLDSIGAHNEVVSLDAPDAEFLGTDPLPIHALGPAQGPWQYSPHLVSWLEAQLPRFDVVILHGLWLYHGYALRKALKRSRRATGARALPQLFIMPHGMLDPYFQRAGGRRLKAARNWLYWKLVEAPLVNESAGLLFTCEAERQLAAQPFRPYRPARELVIGLGVEEPPRYTHAMRTAFRRACPNVPDQPYLLFLSRIDPKKGVDMLVQAFANVTTRPLASPALVAAGAEATVAEEPAAPHLVIAGPGLETAYGQQISRATQALAPAVSLAGMLTGDAKWGAFYGCEAFVLPSHQENFGIAVVEALACGKPVLISDQVNIWREIEAAGAGLVAPDTLAGTEALLTAWHQLPDSQKQGIRERTRACYEHQFAVSAAAHRLDTALRSTISTTIS